MSQRGGAPRPPPEHGSRPLRPPRSARSPPSRLRQPAPRAASGASAASSLSASSSSGDRAASASASSGESSGPLDARCDDRRERLVCVGEDRDAGRRERGRSTRRTSPICMSDTSISIGSGRSAAAPRSRSCASAVSRMPPTLTPSGMPTRWTSTSVWTGLSAWTRWKSTWSASCFTASICRSFTKAR